MKKLISGIILSLALISCSNPGNDVNIENVGSSGEDANNYAVNSYEAINSPRDMSITPAISYSDLFLDSAVVENYIQNEKLSDTVAKAVRNFYNVRNYQYAWFSTNGLLEQARGFWSLYGQEETKESSANNKLGKKMDTLVTSDTVFISTTDTSFTNIELGLTEKFINYTRTNKDEPMARVINMQQFIPVRKWNAMELADTILNRNDSVLMRGVNDQYYLLKNQLRLYHQIAKSRGWDSIKPINKKISKGSSSPGIALIKKRLRLTQQLPGNDTSLIYNDSLELAIKSIQEQHGLKTDGIISDSLVKILNAPVEQRMEQILMNMNRAAWSPARKDSNRIQVNIPSFMLYVYEGVKKVFDMQVVVGKQGTNTTMFTGSLNQIVFSPHWNLPKSIVKDEIMPAMKKDPNYLKKKNMEIVKQNDSIPTIRQLPGPDNSLGKVKFLFPNSYDIYFHDTPKKELFNRQVRAYSHGCIRLADAAKLAEYLLRNNPGWSADKIQQAMNSNKEQYVKLEKPVPVVISYYTTWVDENGRLNFRNDIYGHDKKTTLKLFKRGVNF
jgi:murein L,D-transpeptidase YcbB/YkuD